MWMSCVALAESIYLLCLFLSVSDAKCGGRALVLSCLSLSSFALTVHLVVIVVVLLCLVSLFLNDLSSLRFWSGLFS